MPDVYLPFVPEAAEGRAARARGLLGRGGLDADEGLFIAPCRQVHTFGMRFPIDVAYLSGDNEVLHLVHAMRPWRVARLVPRAAGVLELPAGTLAACGCRVGDRVTWPES